MEERISGIEDKIDGTDTSLMENVKSKNAWQKTSRKSGIWPTVN